MTDQVRANHRRASTRSPGRTVAFTLASLLALTCGGGGGDGAAAANGEGSRTEPSAMDFPAAPTGEVDQALAARGAELFKSRGCVACHTFGGGRLVGPDLMGVTGRRTFEWTFAMITNPDSMLANDETAKALLAEYFTPMTNQNVPPDEVLALYEHMRDQDQGGGAAGN